MEKVFFKRSGLSLAGVLACFFIYSFAASAFFRMVVVCWLFPEFNLEGGFSVPDSVGFHLMALEKANEIRTSGWSAWALRPQNQFPAGMASLLYLLSPSPWLLLAFNSLIHALSGGLLFVMLRRFFSPLASFCGAVMFVVNPLSMEWVANLHRDGIFILGNYLFLSGFLNLLCPSKPRQRIQTVQAFIMGCLGTLLIWLARSYWIQFIWLLAGFFFVAVFFQICREWFSRRVPSQPGGDVLALAASGCLAGFVHWLFILPTTVIANNELPPPSISTPSAAAVFTPSFRGSSAVSGHPRTPTPYVNLDHWIRTPGLPDFVERRLFNLAYQRRGSINTGGNSLVDAEVHLGSAREFLEYFPRAVVVGLGSPFPDLWKGEASLPGYNKARIAMGLITPFCWLCLAGIPLGLRIHSSKAALWWILLFGIGGLLIFTYTYANVGTLLRFRYGFYMLLVASGAASWLDFFNSKGKSWQEKSL